MRDDYRYLYCVPGPIPESALRSGGYSDPVLTDGDRRAYAARLAQTRAELRRARRGELTLVYVLASVIALTILPVLIVVAAACGAVALGRRALWGVTTTWRGGARTPLRLYDVWFAATCPRPRRANGIPATRQLRELLPKEPRGATSQWTY